MWCSGESARHGNRGLRAEHHIFFCATFHLKCARAHFKWNPFAPDVPVEALHVTRRIESFCWRLQQLVGEGGFALVTGAPGAGKSVTLRLLAERLAEQRDVKVGVCSRPQANLADFYREMGDLFGVELRPHNRWACAKVLRERWQTHIDASLARPVLIADEAHEMLSPVLSELRLLRATPLH